jgi:hypothetical protein
MELLMYRVLAAAGALSVTLATAGAALAQTYPAPTYPPPPNAGYYPPTYAAPAPPPPTYYQPAPAYSDPHSGGGAGREYPYGGGPNPN